MSERGGKREGAGRPKGSRSAATKNEIATISDLAKTHSEAALQSLVQIASHGESESARVAASNSILDRAYGKPQQTVDNTSSDGSMSPQPAIDAKKLSSEAMQEILNAATDEG